MLADVCIGQTPKLDQRHVPDKALDDMGRAVVAFVVQTTKMSFVDSGKAGNGFFDLTNALCHRQLRENVAGIMRFELVIMVK